jgi:CheY-like chemotaxis protein
MMPKQTVLVIDDNELNVKLVRGLLKIKSAHVVEALDAETGIQLAHDNLPDLILMDIQLPGMDGLQATKLIKQDPSLKSIPVIALTSYAMRGDKEKALKAGCCDYISKPIDTKSFLEQIDKYID